MKIFNEFDLTEYNSYRISATCKKAYFPESEEDVIFFYSINEPFVHIGSGHNIILSKEYYDINFLIFNGNFNSVELHQTFNVISAEAGASIYDVSLIAEKHSLTGVEFFYDIPSSVGGAVVMNAGTKEGETENILKKVRYLDLTDMIIKERFNDELELEYRNSFFQKQQDKIILKAWFQLASGDKQMIRKIMEESKERRWSKQPREYPNGGSVFKRPPGKFVGPMIDELGLKGYTIGGAQVSKKHSGFIVNINNATGQDILSIIKVIISKVSMKYGVELEIEQRII